MSSSEDNLIAEFSDVTRVVADPLRLKAKLAIGEDAYASLQATRVLGDVWKMGTAAAAGGAVAGSSAVAGTFFGGWLTALGVATAVTPVGWVLGAAAASGAACYGVVQLFRRYEGSRVVKVPAFINTPIDLLAASLFDLMATLAFRVVQEAGDLDDDERESVRSYFIEEWGFDPVYLDAALPVIEMKVSDRAIEEIAEDLARFKLDNPDCNFKMMKAELLTFLTEVAEADGVMDEAEQAAIKRIDAQFDRVDGWIGEGVIESVTAVSGRLWDRASAMIFNPSPAEKLAQPAPEEGADAELAAESLAVPVLWLLGKTGAGKTSLIQAMTGEREAEIGNGFEPCTRTASSYDFPVDEPVIRFLDTRGLGEARYDPTEDLAACEASTHMVLVLARLDDPVQGAIAETLAAIRKSQPKMHVLVVHNAADLVSDHGARARARAATQSLFENVWGEPLPSLELALSQPHTSDLKELRDILMSTLPSVAVFLERQVARDAEEAEFLENRNMVLRFAGTAAATGAVPVVGAASVPVTQIAMLAGLASAYNIEWNRGQLALFGAALGGGVLGGQALGLLGRQAASLVPVVGQTVVPALSASWGFASTYALGRAAAYWMHQTRHGRQVDPDELHARYARAFSRTTADEIS